MQEPPTAKEIKGAAGKRGAEAIPYPDLREKCKKEYAKQLILCTKYSCDPFTTEKEIAAAMERAKACRQQRIIVRTIFAQAIGRVEIALKKMVYGDPLKPDLTTILKKLEESQSGHDNAIDEVNEAFLKCEKKLEKLKN